MAKDPLRVLEAARQYAEQIIELAQSLPRRAPAGLRSQLVESAQAIGAMLAEGFGRDTDPEKVHYSRMANGSLEESQEYLRECVNLQLIDQRTFYKSWNLSVVTSRMLRSLIERIERRRK
jgi:four helix bundle protein